MGLGARRYGIAVSLGVWIGNDLQKNEKEIDTAIRVALANRRTVDRVFVGNEAILRDDVTANQLNNYIRRVREALPNRIKAIQSEVKATRTPEERARMEASMTASKTAKEWAADLDFSQRAPAAVRWLDSLEGQLDVDQMCFAITIAEQVGMYGDGEDEDLQAGEGTDPADPAGQSPTREP